MYSTICIPGVIDVVMVGVDAMKEGCDGIEGDGNGIDVMEGGCDGVIVIEVNIVSICGGTANTVKFK